LYADWKRLRAWRLCHGETAAVNVLGSLGVKHNGGDAWSLTPSKRRSF
jgi:hypothetical protein